jgi:cobalt-zinc-cadmium efflux system outer membrane protein
MRWRLLATAVSALTLSACASTSAAPAFKDASTLAAERTGYRAVWRTGTAEDDEADKKINELLANELTVDAAVQIALLNNRTLPAEYEELGVAQAELVQAGLLKNPVFGGTYRFPLDPGHLAGIEADLVTDFVQLLTRGAAKKIASLNLEATIFRVGNHIVKHAYETKKAWYTVVAAEQMLAMRKVITEAAEAAVEVAQKQYDAGTINELDLANEQSLFAQVTLDLRRTEGNVVTAREHLNRLMGTFGTQTKWRSPGKLPELPKADPSLDHLEPLAVKRRLDLLAARRDVEVLSYGLSLAKNTRWAGFIDAGVSFERKPEGIRLLGPTVSFEIPIFDQRQAAIARIEAMLRQAKAREYALAVDIRSEVRESRNDVMVARAVAETYGTKLVPLRVKVVELSQQFYDAMLLGVFQLLLAKQQEIEAFRSYIDAARDYWIARAELDMATGGALPLTNTGSKKS